MRYLRRIHFNDLEGYCIYRCNKIMNEYTHVRIWYYRGQFKGYSYVIKLVRKTKPNSYEKVPFHEIYNHLKKARIDINSRYHSQLDYTKGIEYSLYDSINYLNGIIE